MPRKDDKEGRPSNKTGKPSSRKASTKQTKSIDQNPDVQVSIGGDVSESIVSVRIFSRGWLTQRLMQYRRQPSLLLFDLPFIIVLLSILTALGYLVFVFLYYGTTTTLFSNPGSLLIFTRLDRAAYRLLDAGAVAFLIVLAYQAFRRSLTKRGFLSSSLAIFFLALVSLGMVGLTARLRTTLIALEYPLTRADELVAAGQFDLANEIIQLYPVGQRIPLDLQPLVQERDQQSWSFHPQPGYPEYNEALETFGAYAYELYNKGNYLDILRSVCGISHTELWEGLLPSWRSAVYVIAHDPAWGLQRTLDWIAQLAAEFPDCQKMASPFWLAIPPEIAWDIERSHWGPKTMGQLYDSTSLSRDNPIDEMLSATDIRDSCKGNPPENLGEVPPSTYQSYQRCEYDMRLAEELLERYPEDPYAGFAKFFLGRLDQIVEEGYSANPNVYDLAFYEKGWRQYHAQDYEGALLTFERFMFRMETPAGEADHPWRDDALWRASLCHERLGEHIAALQKLSQMEGAGDGYIPNYADMNANALYVADVLMPVADLTRVVSENLVPNLLPILKYTLAERLLAEGSYAAARQLFLEIASEYQGQVFEPILGKKYSLSVLAGQKAKVAEILSNYEETHSEDANLLVADYLDTYDAFSPLENELRYYIPMFDYRDITADYLVGRSKTYVAARLREDYVNAHPRDPRVPDLIFKIARGYETVASWADLPASDDFLPMVRRKATDAYLRYVDLVPQGTGSEVDEALERSGSLYLSRCLYDPVFRCDMESILGMRNVYLQLVDRYPEHRLANNFLNWIAWSYCYEANLPGNSEQQYVDAYTLALAAYSRIAENYPDGPIGENARKNIVLIQEKIRNPSNRANFPPIEWGW